MMNREEMMKEIVTELRHVPDPELGVNIVDIGLIYGIDIDSENNLVNIEMSLSTPACPLGDIIMENVRAAVESVMPGYSCKVKLTWEPAWNMAFMSERGRLELLGNV